MRILRKNPHRSSGFTLVEMIGVLAVIAVLAAMLIPKIFEAINTARLNNAIRSIDTIRKAIAEHVGDNGSFTGPAGIELTTTHQADFDTTVLMVEGRIDKGFTVKLGGSTKPQIQLKTPSTSGGTATIQTAGGYDLDGNGTVDASFADTNSAWVVEAVITGVSAPDAKALNDRIDGTTSPFAAPALNALDKEGRVQYAAIVAAATGTVYIYLAHR